MRIAAAVACLALLLSPLGAAAAGYEAIILGGGADKAAAQKFVDEFKGTKGARWLEPAAGYPRVEDSASLAGLNPGFQIAVLGFCTTASGTASAARDLLNYLGAGAYTKVVKASFPKACPKLNGARARAPKGLEQVGTAKVGGGLPTLEWRVLLGKDPAEPMLVLQVLQAGREIAVHTLTGDARAPAPEAEGDYGASSDWKFGEFVDDGLRTMVWVTNGRYGGDTGDLTHYLYGLACGEIRELVELGNQMDPCCGPPETFTLTRGPKKGTLRLVHRLDLEETEKTRNLAFDSEKCAVVEQ